MSDMASCALCDNEISSRSIREGKRGFCCPGCHAVFNILSSTDQLANYQQTPVFQQAVKSGLISNPALLEQIRQNRLHLPENELVKLHLEIGEMWCPACAEIIRLILLREKGVCNCVVDYATDLASVEFSPRYISKERIFELINTLGYRPSPLENAQRKVSFSLYLQFIIAAFCSLNVMMLAYPIYATYFDYDDQGMGMLFAWISLAVSFPVVSYCAWPIWRRFSGSLRAGLFGMETLVVIGIGTAFGLSLYNLLHGSSQVYFDSLTVIITFVLLGKIIESRAKFSAKTALIRLAYAMPRRGRKRLLDGSYAFVPIKEIYPGDVVVAYTGEKIVLDGSVVEGEGTCNESLMTGEPMPVQKQINSKLVSGAILQSGTLAYRVTAKAEDSVLHRILDMVQQEIGHKTAYVRAADKIVTWFVPGVLLVALLAALTVLAFGFSLESALIRAISVLLISCPCAIGIAAPLAESHVINGLASLGAIVRNRGCLSLLGKETVFVFDKTGTITEGVFTILRGLESLDGKQLAVLKGLASQSTHPIAQAIANAIQLPATSVTHIEEHAGKGLQGRCETQKVYLGSADFISQFGFDISSKHSTEHTSTVYFASQAVFPIVLGDKVRKEAKDLGAALAPAKTMLLSGDSATVVETVAKACGFDSWYAGCSPVQKKETIENLRKHGQVVCMVGDGINDAPSLTAAHIGISMVSATDISIQVSDLLLTTDRLSVLPKIRSLAMQGQRIVKQNLFWAFCYNVIGIGLAACGMLTPIFAVAAMVASSLMVLINAQRIRPKGK